MALSAGPGETGSACAGATSPTVAARMVVSASGESVLFARVRHPCGHPGDLSTHSAYPEPVSDLQCAATLLLVRPDASADGVGPELVGRRLAAVYCDAKATAVRTA